MYSESSTQLHTLMIVYFDEMNVSKAWLKNSWKHLISTLNYSLISLSNFFMSCFSASVKLKYYVRTVSYRQSKRLI